MYLYWANKERDREDRDPRPVPDAPWIVLWKRITGQVNKVALAPSGYVTDAAAVHDNASSGFRSPGDEKTQEKSHAVVEQVGPPRARSEESRDWIELERHTAYHLLRTASWQAIFYMITSDILGFQQAPYSFYTLGIAPGCLVFTFLFLLAFAGGQMLWRMYMRLDSEQYPVTCYSDLAERTYGRWVRHVFTVLQTIQ